MTLLTRHNERQTDDTHTHLDISLGVAHVAAILGDLGVYPHLPTTTTNTTHSMTSLAGKEEEGLSLLLCTFCVVPSSALWHRYESNSLVTARERAFLSLPHTPSTSALLVHHLTNAPPSILTLSVSASCGLLGCLGVHRTEKCSTLGTCTCEQAECRSSDKRCEHTSSCHAQGGLSSPPSYIESLFKLRRCLAREATDDILSPSQRCGAL